MALSRNHLNTHLACVYFTVMILPLGREVVPLLAYVIGPSSSMARASACHNISMFHNP